jgi:hypothetical protein
MTSRRDSEASALSSGPAESPPLESPSEELGAGLLI